MKPTEQTLLEQMKIHDAEVHHRKELLDVSHQDAALLLKCRAFIQAHVDEIVQTFYKKQTSFKEIALIIGDADTLKRLISAQKDYIISLFDGHYDLDYVNYRLRIGLVHKRIGVEPKYYLSAVKTLRDILIMFLEAEIHDADSRRSTFFALDKLLYFDTILVFDTYIRSLIAAIESAKEKSEQYAISLEEQVAERTRELHDLSRRDSLTGLYNHRGFLELLERDLSYARRNSQPLSLVYFDIDKFKSVNDTLGHLQGDEILRTVGSILLAISRDIDVPCRYGGDEFCVVLSGCAITEAETFCQRLIGQFREAYPAMTLSIGIAQTGPNRFELHEKLIKRADSAMYEAKKVQGFQVCTFPQDEVANPTSESTEEEEDQ